MITYTSDSEFVYLNGILPVNIVRDQLNATKTKKGWRIPKNLHALREIWTHIPALKTNRKLIEDGKMLKQQQDFWLKMKDEHDVIDSRLRLYQNEDSSYLIQRGSCLVLNEPRTGKTPTMISVLKALGSRRNIVICPSSLVFNWAKEFANWYPEIDVFPVNGTPKKRQSLYESFNVPMGKRVLIISKDTFKTDKDLHEMKFDAAIVDEAHFLRNYKTAQSKAIFGLQAKVKYALTGTPAVKHAVDVYGLLKFINPTAFPSYWQFAERYFHITEDQWAKRIGAIKPRREIELKEFMAVNSVQRKRKEVMRWLPNAQHQTLPVKMEGKQLKLYDQMFDVFEATLEDTTIDAANKLTQLLRLRQLCIDPRLLGLDVKGAKTEALLEFAEDNQDPFIVMTTFSSYFKIIKPELEKLGKKVGIIDGSISKSQKQKTAEEFQKGKIDILLCNIIAAGTGFTLDRADTIVFLDKDFNPANNEQAQDRIVPTTQERYHNINIISLVCQGSVDERVNEILDNKEDLTKLINKPELLRS